MDYICGLAKNTANINITTRMNQKRYVTFRNWKSIRLCQSFQILTFARRFWAEIVDFWPLPRTRFWASGIFLTLKVSFGPMGLDFALLARLWASDSQFIEGILESIFGPQGVDFWPRVFITGLKFVDRRNLGLWKLILSIYGWYWRHWESFLVNRKLIVNLWE